MGLDTKILDGSETSGAAVAPSSCTLLGLLGLREEHTLLDVGPVSVEAGVFFLRHVAAGHYFVLEHGEHAGEDRVIQRVGPPQVLLKRPTVARDSGFTLTTFGRTFDFLLADGVFSQATEQQFERCLAQARLVMKPESMFAATVPVWQSAPTGTEDASGDTPLPVDPVLSSRERVTELAARHDLHCHWIGWPAGEGQQWVLFTRPWWQGTIPERVMSPPQPSPPPPPQPSPQEPEVAPQVTEHDALQPETRAPKQLVVAAVAGDPEATPKQGAALVLMGQQREAPVIVPPSSASLSTDSDLRILVDHVAVRYRASQAPMRSLKEYVIRRLQGHPGEQGFWALTDVSLTVHRGEVVGVIGRNGAGKSTLLKTVSRVLRPTSGRIVVRGQLTPLLELGAGFHMELTGRENVYLNSALLGHPRREVDAVIEEIIEFSELRAFLDVPVRTYSTGMIGRLGFAIATAWSPDILILDEILGVGDSAFQQKCAGRIAEMQKHASTVLLVSHSDISIRRMCKRAIWIDRGVVRADGPTDEVLEQYHRFA
jgi:ABC-2 type transport system ATP-binding protein/lipopolysaccharide transport system ATP-binding protein